MNAPEGSAGWIPWAIAALSLVVTALSQFRRARVDDNTVALQMWEGLAKAHTTEIEALTKRVTAAEEQIARMRQEHSQAMTEQEKRHEQEMKALRDENAGLMRMIVQNSKSTAHRVGDVEGTAITTAARKARGESA